MKHVLSKVLLTFLLLFCHKVEAKSLNSLKSKKLEMGIKAARKDIAWAVELANTEDYKVSADTLFALCWGEGLATKLVQHKNPTHQDGGSLSHGVCQVKLETAKFLDQFWHLKTKATVKRLEIDRINEFYAAKAILFYLSEYEGNLDKAVDAYNKGHLVSENSEYVKKFKSHQKYLQKWLN